MYQAADPAHAPTVAYNVPYVARGEPAATPTAENAGASFNTAVASNAYVDTYDHTEEYSVVADEAYGSKPDMKAKPRVVSFPEVTSETALPHRPCRPQGARPIVHKAAGADFSTCIAGPSTTPLAVAGSTTPVTGHLEDTLEHVTNLKVDLC